MSDDQKQVKLRDARIADMAEIQAIYAEEVLHGVSSWEEIPPEVEEMCNRFESIIAAGYPYLVAEINNLVGGYCYASSYRPRIGYRFTVEDTVYVHRHFRGLGIGRLLIDELVAVCTARGFRQMIAVIGDSDNRASIDFHARMGFKRSGLLRSIGYKYDRWMDSVIMQKQLGDGDGTLPH
jgi:phosphinothricin acetyltransferase